MTGVIGVSLTPVLKPRRFSSCLKKAVFSHMRSISASPSALCSTSRAALQVATTLGGCEVLKRKGRARCSISIAQLLVGGHVAAHGADGLGQRAHLDVPPAVEAEVVDRAAPVLAQHARGVGVVDHADGAVGLGTARRSVAAGRCRRPC